ncbi:hypothetical protein JCM8547_005675 [Rhodosporidiobolus lusitaniae]
MSDDTAARTQADDLKQQGNTAYKNRDFDTAEKLYKQAWDAYPKDITYKNNLAAVYFEKGDYETAIKTCEDAIEAGRDLRADFKLLAKAYARIGSSYLRLSPPNYEEGIKNLHKSLTEHRTPDVLARLKEAEREKSKAEKRAYEDPAKADAAREEGNTAFKAGDFATAVSHYSESIKRNPRDARGYTNRAQAYTKLMALPEALKDAEKAIEVDPNFVKGYIRKSTVLLAMKEVDKALAAIELAAEKDTSGSSSREISQQTQKVLSSLASTRAGETDEQAYARALRDPEVQAIMGDPVMQGILQQAQQDPKSLQNHMMSNPAIAQKVQTLVRAGIIKTGRA